MHQIDVIHEDDELLVVHKPAGIPTTAPEKQDCLMRRLEERFAQGELLHASSRLDLPVTGLVVIARTKRANQVLLAAREEGRYGRRYVSIMQTPPEQNEGRWTWPISIDPAQRKLRTTGPGAATRDAATRFVVVGTSTHASLVHLFPETGRTHQLRVHAAAAGSPIVGDLTYGAPKRVVVEDGRVVAAKRVMLHCAEITLSVPGAPMRFVARVPNDMRDVWLRLGGRDDLLA